MHMWRSGDDQESVLAFRGGPGIELPLPGLAAVTLPTEQVPQ